MSTVPFLARSMAASAIAVGVLLLGAQPASAANCIQDVWKAHGNNQNLTCTAQDVTLSEVTNIDVTAGGGMQNRERCEGVHVQSRRERHIYGRFRDEFDSRYTL
jgi:hypothetical protein